MKGRSEPVHPDPSDPPQRSGIGARIRAMRHGLGLTQADLAARAGISPSYLNLIEHDRRRIGGHRLADIARHLGVEQADLTYRPGATLLAALEAAAPGEDAGAFAQGNPAWARRVAEQQGTITALEARIAAQRGRMARDPTLVAALHQIVTSASAIQSTAAILTGGGLDADWQGRFQRNVHDDSRRLAAASEALMRYVERLGEAQGDDTSGQGSDGRDAAEPHAPDADPPGRRDHPPTTGR